MHLDATDMAIVGGGGTAGLTFVLGVVQRYVGPRLEALRERIERLEADNKEMRERCDEFDITSRKERADLDARLTAKITHGHDRINPLEAAVARIQGKLSG